MPSKNRKHPLGTRIRAVSDTFRTFAGLGGPPTISGEYETYREWMAKLTNLMCARDVEGVNG